jgi:hypothetical protein
VRAVHPDFVVEPEPESFAESILGARERALANDGHGAKMIAEQFSDITYLADFEKRFNKVVAQVRGKQR